MTLSRTLRVLSAFAVALAPALGASVAAQSGSSPAPAAPRPAAPAARAANAPAPRTPDGRPDLQGTWDFAQLTPFERPGQFGEKSVLSDVEADRTLNELGEFSVEMDDCSAESALFTVP